MAFSEVFTGLSREEFNDHFTVHLGKENVDDRMYINFHSFEKALAFKRAVSPEVLNYDGQPLSLSFPRFGRDRVLALFTKRTEELLLSKKSEYSIADPIDSNVRSGTIHIGRIRLGHVNVSQEIGEDGKYSIHFSPPKDIDDLLPSEDFLDSFRDMVDRI